MSKKTFLLDTNILMQTEGSAVFGFDDNNVVITHTTVEELDHFKNDLGEKGYEAREAIRTINGLRVGKGSLRKGYTLPSRGTFRIETNHISKDNLPKGWDLSNPDNRIISTAVALNKTCEGEFYLITNDTNMSIKAESVDVPSATYHNDEVSTQEVYTGRNNIKATEKMINTFYKEESVKTKAGYHPNEYLCMTNGNQSALGIYQDKKIMQIYDPKHDTVRPRNQGQRFATDALHRSAETIPLVILSGPAGTGKTILSLGAALDQKDSYDQVIITRSNTLSDDDIGYLPGSLEEKMAPLLAPFFDNLRTILRQGQVKNNAKADTEIKEMVDSGFLNIVSLAYIRGRSIPSSFIIIDEAQNLSINQIKTIVSRAGLRTKIVFLGDPNQIDTPKLSKKNNGLVWLAEKMKDSPLCAEIAFQDNECVRSPLAKEVINFI